MIVLQELAGVNTAQRASIGTGTSFYPESAQIALESALIVRLAPQDYAARTRQTPGTASDASRKEHCA